MKAFIKKQKPCYHAFLFLLRVVYITLQNVEVFLG